MLRLTSLLPCSCCGQMVEADYAANVLRLGGVALPLPVPPFTCIWCRIRKGGEDGRQAELEKGDE